MSKGIYVAQTMTGMQSIAFMTQKRYTKTSQVSPLNSFFTSNLAFFFSHQQKPQMTRTTYSNLQNKYPKQYSYIDQIKLNYKSKCQNP